MSDRYQPYAMKKTPYVFDYTKIPWTLTKHTVRRAKKTFSLDKIVAEVAILFSCKLIMCDSGYFRSERWKRRNRIVTYTYSNDKMEKRGIKRPYDSEDENKAEVGVKVLYFDLETTGLNGQICSMAFLSSDGGENFFRFLIPKCSFHPMATKINKMTLLNGKLHHNGKIVDSAVPIEDGLQHFVDWLTKMIKNYGKIIMVSTYLQNIS